jgi:hypothetical protein
VGVDALRVDIGEVPGASGDHQVVGETRVGQDLPQPGDPTLQRVGRVGRQILAPQRVDQRAGRHYPAGVQQEKLQDRPLGAGRQGPDLALDDQFERSKDAELHDASRPR